MSIAFANIGLSARWTNKEVLVKFKFISIRQTVFDADGMSFLIHFTLSNTLKV